MKVLLRLTPYLVPYRKLILGSTLLAIPVALIGVAPVKFVQYVFDHLLASGDRSKLALVSLAFIGIYLINFVVRFFHYYFLRIVVARVNLKIKNDLYEHLLGLSADYFTTQSTGNLISRVGSDPQYIDGGLSCINIIIREPLKFIFLLIYALKINWRLTLITFLIFPPLAYVFSATSRNLKRYINRMTEENARLFSTLQESFTGIRVIKTFRLEKYFRKKFRERGENFTHFLLKTASLEEASHPLVELLIAAAAAAIIYEGGLQIFDGQMRPGDLVAFFAAFASMMDPIRRMNDVSIKLNSAATASKRIFEVFDWKSNLHEPETPITYRQFDRSISFENVSFSYPDDASRNILDEVSFEIKKGQAIAFVGPSGAGKSSLVSLLPRIFDVTKGTIFLDGHDIRQISLEDLRKLISVVSQDVFLFNDTIEENIRCGKLSANKEEIREAARHAHALDFIEASPQGFQTVIGDRGQKLSGGEKQRISIARAFLRQSPILVLDEATSSLDTHSEREVQIALEELMKDRTTLLIAHRLSTIKHVDQILVMRDGRIVERGSHTELVAAQGEYVGLLSSGQKDL